MKSRDGSYLTARTRSGSFSVRFYSEDNVRYEKKVKSKTERDALVRSIKKREDLSYWYPSDNLKNLESTAGTFNELADIWLNHSESVREVSLSCLINYRSHLKNHIRPSFGEKPLCEFSIKAIEILASELKKKKPLTRSYVSVRKNRMDEELFEDDEVLSMAYRREILTVACMVTKHGFERGYLTENPFAEFKLPDCPEQPYDYWRLTDEDKFLDWLENGGVFYKRVAKSGSHKMGKPQFFDRIFKMRPGKAEDLYDIVLFALRSGLRKGEIGALRLSDVNFANNFLIIGRTWSEREKCVKKTTKGKNFRRIEMNEDMRQILKRRSRRVKSDAALLFDTRSWAVKNFSKYCAKAGVREIHFHSLRHTCLTNLANGYGMEKPLPLPQVQIIAGHKDISTTMRYVHTDGIENTSSLQWSREQRRALQNKTAFGESSKLRLISSGNGS